ncbi:MAG: FliM/FliN family flagellar motor switch protein [Planctomycetes bacterium]|nr:FliM/FliN family flagellar motor switch protein [Planctomycetota bacterium]
MESPETTDSPQPPDSPESPELTPEDSPQPTPASLPNSESGSKLCLTIWEAGCKAWVTALSREITYAPGETALTTPVAALPGEPGECVLTEVQWSGDREGKFTLLVPANGAKEIVAAMMTAMMGEEHAAADTQLDAEGLDAYSEAVSQFLGQASQTLRQDPGGDVNLAAMPENTKVIDFASTPVEEALGGDPLICSPGEVTIAGSDPIKIHTFMEPALAGDNEGGSAVAGKAPGNSNLAGAGSLGDESAARAMVKGLKLPVQVTLAEKQERLKMIMDLVPGSIVEFKKSSEEFLDMRIGKITIARGEAVIVDEHFGLQIREIVDVLAEIEKQKNA